MASQDRVRAGLLFDWYGPLLTQHQQDVWQLYYWEDWSLAEIGTSQGVSRAAVHDMLERTDRLLEEYEERLGLLRQHQRRRTHLAEAMRLAEQLMPVSEDAQAIRAILKSLAEEEGLSDV